VIAREDFAELGADWGSADPGGPWTCALVPGVTATISSQRGAIAIAAELLEGRCMLQEISATDVDVKLRMSRVMLASIGQMSGWIDVHGLDNNVSYRLEIGWPDGAAVYAYLWLIDGTDGTLLTAASLPALVPEDVLHVRFAVGTGAGGNQSVLTAKVWGSAAGEPIDATVQAVDNDARLQRPGAIGVGAWAASGASGTLFVDDFQAEGWR
jgi:hypothetical protein